MLKYFIDNRHMIWSLTLQHIGLTLTTIVIATIIAVPLGYYFASHKIANRVIMPIFSLIYTIPSLAFFVLLIPLFGLGTTPALIALVSYTMFVLVRNTVVGYQQVDDRMVEAARSLGYNRWTIIWRFKTLYALPTIISGLRIATTSTIGIATIASYINAGGLGTMLFTGLNENNYTEVVVGSIVIAVFALIVNWALERLQTRVLRYVSGLS
ncbi:ABC transporter permease [Paucilactobacillus suebicus]|uniref:Binding-protein-dependent transport system inner membrane protein n=1 Tax=Paucilactobacillus suebicus DSM 5007 = KCTC 3549 TaxID=1423807 RepID=A0A0R1VX73_9LACO|nr:ABC transporter permease [Paucilactobacillus suebicus]KRM10296.1 binding-protein-dependent transport system inner membrane protein [Paucilactobacillus suebicus DSM 5007 = KCTC 3549]